MFVKNFLLFALVLSVMIFAEKPSGVWRFARTNSMYSTAWNHPGSIFDLGDRQICHYTGQINFPVNRSGTCDDILILHLARAQAMEENGKIIGAMVRLRLVLPGYGWILPDQ